jgi:hypothetical protein
VTPRPAKFRLGAGAPGTTRADRGSGRAGGPRANRERRSSYVRSWSDGPGDCRASRLRKAEGGTRTLEALTTPNGFRDAEDKKLDFALERGISAIDNVFTWKTETALEVFQHDKGFDETGELDIDDAVFLPESVRIAKVTGELGGSARPGAQVAQATSDTLEVQVDLEASQQGEVKKGDRAQNTLPGNKSVKGKVDRLGKVAHVPCRRRHETGPAFNASPPRGVAGAAGAAAVPARRVAPRPTTGQAA